MTGVSVSHVVPLDDENRLFAVEVEVLSFFLRWLCSAENVFRTGIGHLLKQPLVGADRFEIFLFRLRYRADADPPILQLVGLTVREMQAEHMQGAGVAIKPEFGPYPVRWRFPSVGRSAGSDNFRHAAQSRA